MEKADFTPSCSLIKTRVCLASADNSERMDDAIALWDTGSEYCGVSQKVVQRLGLKVIGYQKTGYGDGTVKDEPVYAVCITFPLSGRRILVHAAEFAAEGEDFILGMNVIGNGTFRIEPIEEGFRFTFSIETNI